jgi:heme A synthase
MVALGVCEAVDVLKFTLTMMLCATVLLMTWLILLS